VFTSDAMLHNFPNHPERLLATCDSHVVWTKVNLLLQNFDVVFVKNRCFHLNISTLSATGKYKW